MFPPQTMHLYVANHEKLPNISIGFMIPPQIHSTFHDLFLKRRGHSAQNQFKNRWVSLEVKHLEHF